MRLNLLLAARTLAIMAAFALPTLAMTVPAQAAVEVDINHGDIQPLPIAIAPLGRRGRPHRRCSAPTSAKVISANLDRSGFFKPARSQ